METEDSGGFTPADAGAVHHAMQEAAHQAEERAERMPSSAEAYRTQAERLRVVRDKILEFLPQAQKWFYRK